LNSNPSAELGVRGERFENSSFVVEENGTVGSSCRHGIMAPSRLAEVASYCYKLLLTPSLKELQRSEVSP